MGADTTVREQLLERIGPFPESTDPDPTVRSTEQCDGYERRLIEYSVEPDERIRAYLLVPDDAGPDDERPGIVAIHQHGGSFHLGKSEPVGLSSDETFFYGLELCERGYVVLCPDLLCFEDRQPPEYRRKEGMSPDGGGFEKFEAMRYLLRGSTLQAKYLSDLSVATDVLVREDGVDADAIGTIGHSLGGQEAIWLAWYDDRISAAVSSCGASLYESILENEIKHNFAFYIPGLLEVCDIDEVIAEIAPRAMMLVNGESDPIFPVDAVREMAGTVSDRYEQLGVEERFESVVFPGGHGFPESARTQAYDWLDQRLE